MSAEKREKVTNDQQNTTKQIFLSFLLPVYLRADSCSVANVSTKQVLVFI